MVVEADPFVAASGGEVVATQLPPLGRVQVVHISAVGALELVQAHMWMGGWMLMWVNEWMDVYVGGWMDGKLYSWIEERIENCIEAP